MRGDHTIIFVTDRRTCYVLLMILSVVVSCKKAATEETKTKTAPVVSPRANPTASANPPTTVQPGAPARRRVNRGSDWRYAKPKAPAKAAPAAGSAAPAAAREDAGAPEKESDRVATLKAAEKALNGASRAIKSCYDRHKAKSGSATVRFTVQRSGYVISPSVSGVDAKLATCIKSVVGRLKISGVKARVVMTRTLQFRSWRKK